MRTLKTAVPAAALVLTTAATADMVELDASKDNSMYTGFASNTNASGAGPNLFVGRTALGFDRRTLIAFDVSAIPAGSTINSATLSLVLDMSISGDEDLTLHRVQQDWGEGTSVPDAGGGGGGGSGGAPTAGSSTWEHTFFPGSIWTTQGGDFDAAPSATTVVGGGTFAYFWSSATMAAEVQAWVDAPATNFGWIVIGDEINSVTAKRFVSREGSAGNEPKLRIDFTPPANPCPERGDFDGDGSVGFSDLTSLLNNWGPCPGCPQDLNGDDVVGFADLTTLLSNWGPCP
jgi:hypothetical protein